MQTEIWKPVVGFAGFYEVSDCGNVRSVDRTISQIGPHGESVTRLIRSRIRKVKIGENGYHTVTLKAISLGVKSRCCLIHRLVLESFAGLPKDGEQGRHFPDADKSNNHLSNLAWGSPKQNQADRHEQGSAVNGDSCHLAKITNDQAAEIRRRLDSGEQIRAVAREYKMSESAVGHIKARRSWGKALAQ